MAYWMLTSKHTLAFYNKKNEHLHAKKMVGEETDSDGLTERRKP